MLAQLGGIRGAQERAIHRQDTQILPGITVMAFASPLVAGLAEQPFDRIGAEPFAGLADTTSRQQVVGSQALGADIQAPGHFMDGLIAE
ncbi:hypothetical protein D3C84_908540 [compost metagenome]